MNIILVLFGGLAFTVATWIIFLPSGLLIFRRGKATIRATDLPVWERVDKLNEFDD